MDLAGVLAAAFLIAAQATAPSVVPRDAAPVDCGSVVVLRCSAPAEPPAAVPRATRTSAPPDATLLDPVVIEAERLRASPSLQELLQRAARPGGPVQFTARKFGGSTCTCFEPCLMNCCQCPSTGDARPGFATGR